MEVLYFLKVFPMMVGKLIRCKIFSAKTWEFEWKMHDYGVEMQRT